MSCFQWVKVRLLRNVPEEIGGGWYKGGLAGDTQEVPDATAARLVAEGSADLVDWSTQLWDYLAMLVASEHERRSETYDRLIELGRDHETAERIARQTSGVERVSG